jgi:flagellar biosynthesis chaperone FliJ
MEKEGGQPKGQKKGQNQGMSQGLAKMAAQQEGIRRQMQELIKELDKKGNGGSGNLDKLAKKMEETENDLVNKRISNETLKRQQDILTRLLEAENAEREREMDEKRKSNEAKTQNLSNPSDFFEYKKLKEKEMELLKTVPVSLYPFYKNKVSEYFNKIED